ncbi:MAG: alanine--tRNA ligase [Thermodesulfobacteriota bacterium]
MTGNEVRKKFIDYFAAKNHQLVRSSSLVPHDDPTLLFTNAGMVQFKRVFIGEEFRPYTTAATAQKCVRAGGKHNDLENVGYTARHHTFFEMLGNFSFGDYFKEKAVEYAWDLLVNGYGLPPEKLWISIYLDDDEAFEIWNRKIGVPGERIIRLGKKDNFWAMGDTGPCGPCSEIHIDRGDQHGCGRPDCAVGCDCDRFLEIWNLVFMQYNQEASGELTPLPKPSIDTGMGLERIASVLQQAHTNYETDLFLPIIRQVEELSEKRLGQSPTVDVAMKVIADHSRSTAFLIGDGVLPSNEGRGYVLRRIMRRAIRYGRNIGLKRPFLHRTAGVVFDIMAGAYPELRDSGAFITNVIENEEIRFAETLDNGLKLLNDTLAELKSRQIKTIPGDVIFKLYDTYGFPVDIVRDVVRDDGMQLDTDGFQTAMDAQRAKSRSVAAFTKIGDAYKSLSAGGFKTEFVGYETLRCEATVKLLVAEGEALDTAGAGMTVEVVTDRTPFYAESGGQVGDAGEIHNGAFSMDVIHTVKDPTGLVIHKGTIRQGGVRCGDSVTLTVADDGRNATALNHTATHILHAALRKIVGEHVKQAGSLVSPERLRFDFSHFAALDRGVLDRIETYVNGRIRENFPVISEEMAAEEAFRTGATALFEEKYGDRVRVISLGEFSKEFCGGTHARRTGDIGFFKIIGEASVAAGVRRIEALTGESALTHVQDTVRIVQETSLLLKEKPESLRPRVEKLMADLKNLEKETERLKTRMALMSSGDGGREEYPVIAGVRVVVRKVAVDKPAALRELADQFKDRIKSGVVVLGAEADGKAMLIAAVTKDLTGRFHAGNIVKLVAAEVGGAGGGRPDMAQAGGSQPEKLDAALAKVPEFLQAV